MSIDNIRFYNKKMNISALLIARNEQDIIKNCLESLGFADEIIVICCGFS